MKKFHYIVIALSALFLFGCTDNTEENTLIQVTDITYENPTEITDNTDSINSEDSASRQNASPRYGGTLKMSMRIPKTLNPLVNEDVTVDKVLKIMFEPLFKKDNTVNVFQNIA